jgi:ankyrin repeat protein
MKSIITLSSILLFSLLVLNCVSTPKYQYFTDRWGKDFDYYFEGTEIDGLFSNVEPILSEKIKSEILSQDFNVNLSGRHGVTLLHWFIGGHDLNAIKFLLEAGADPNKVCYEVITPISLSILFHSVELMELLSEFGTDLNMVRIDEKNGAHLYHPLSLAISSGKSSRLLSTLLRLGSNPNFYSEVSKDTQQSNFLWHTAFWEEWEKFQLLLDYGADPMLTPNLWEQLMELFMEIEEGKPGFSSRFNPEFLEILEYLNQLEGVK